MLDASTSQTQEHGRTSSCKDVVAAALLPPRHRTLSAALPLLQVRARIRLQAATASPRPYPFGLLSHYRNTAPALAARTRTRCCSSLMSRPPGPRAVTRVGPDMLWTPPVFTILCLSIVILQPASIKKSASPSLKEKAWHLTWMPLAFLASLRPQRQPTRFTGEV